MHLCVWIYAYIYIYIYPNLNVFVYMNITRYGYGWDGGPCCIWASASKIYTCIWVSSCGEWSSIVVQNLQMSCYFLDDIQMYAHFVKCCVTFPATSKCRVTIEGVLQCVYMCPKILPNFIQYSAASESRPWNHTNLNVFQLYGICKFAQLLGTHIKGI